MCPNINEKVSNMSVGIVGSEGFIGKHLLAEFQEGFQHIEHFSRIHTVLNSSQELNEKIANLDVLIWAASGVNPSVAAESPSKVNEELKYWRLLLDEISLKAKNLRLVFLSSGGCTYSDQDTYFSEKSVAEGTNAYGVMKVQIERMLLDRLSSSQILRLSNVYGPGQKIGKGQGVIAEWIHTALENNYVKAFGSLQSYRDYIYVSDVASAVKEIAINKTPQKLFNIGSGSALTLEDLFSVLNKQFDKKLTLLRMEHRSFDRLGYSLNCEEIFKQTSWKPKIDIHEGIDRTVRFELGQRALK